MRLLAMTAALILVLAPTATAAKGPTRPCPPAPDAVGDAPWAELDMTNLKITIGKTAVTVELALRDTVVELVPKTLGVEWMVWFNINHDGELRIHRFR